MGAMFPHPPLSNSAQPRTNFINKFHFSVLEAVARVRNAQNCIKVFPKYITGEDLFGLTEPAIVKVVYKNQV